MRSARNHQAYWAFLGHRLSGLALALFLPVHFYVLGMALDEARFDRFLKLSDMPAMKVGEWGWSCCWRCTCVSACACWRWNCCPGVRRAMPATAG